MNDFGDLLIKYMDEGGWTCTGLASVAGIDPSYIHRLRKNHRHRPAKEVVESIARAMKLSDAQTFELVVITGQLPSGFVYRDAFYEVAKTLDSDRLTMYDKIQLEKAIILMCQHWGRSTSIEVGKV